MHFEDRMNVFASGQELDEESTKAVFKSLLAFESALFDPQTRAVKSAKHRYRSKSPQSKFRAQRLADDRQIYKTPQELARDWRQHQAHLRVHSSLLLAASQDEVQTFPRHAPAQLDATLQPSLNEQLKDLLVLGTPLQSLTTNTGGLQEDCCKSQDDDDLVEGVFEEVFAEQHDELDRAILPDAILTTTTTTTTTSALINECHVQEMLDVAAEAAWGEMCKVLAPVVAKKLREWQQARPPRTSSTPRIGLQTAPHDLDSPRRPPQEAPWRMMRGSSPSSEDSISIAESGKQASTSGRMSATSVDNTTGPSPWGGAYDDEGPMHVGLNRPPSRSMYDFRGGHFIEQQQQLGQQWGAAARGPRAVLGQGVLTPSGYRARHAGPSARQSTQQPAVTRMLPRHTATDMSLQQTQPSWPRPSTARQYLPKGNPATVAGQGQGQPQGPPATGTRPGSTTAARSASAHWARPAGLLEAQAAAAKALNALPGGQLPAAHSGRQQLHSAQPQGQPSRKGDNLPAALQPQSAAQRHGQSMDIAQQSKSQLQVTRQQSAAGDRWAVRTATDSAPQATTPAVAHGDGAVQARGHGSSVQPEALSAGRRGRSTVMQQPQLAPQSMPVHHAPPTAPHPDPLGRSDVVQPAGRSSLGLQHPQLNPAGAAGGGVGASRPGPLSAQPQDRQPRDFGFVSKLQMHKPHWLRTSPSGFQLTPAQQQLRTGSQPALGQHQPQQRSASQQYGRGPGRASQEAGGQLEGRLGVVRQRQQDGWISLSQPEANEGTTDARRTRLPKIGSQQSLVR